MSKFVELDLCEPCLKGLNAAHFNTTTPVQRSSIPLALSGRDLWVTSPTGSGKTLCYLLPFLDLLSRASWSHADGLGALVLVPTRELAVQVFDVLKSIGKFFTLSAGLLIGGKSYDQEAKGLSRVNILVATPGRFLHHLDKTAQFTPSSLKVLVIDEFDLLLEMGFLKSTQAIVAALPLEKQALLFSATASSNIRSIVKDLVNTSECTVVHCSNTGEVTSSALIDDSDNSFTSGASIPSSLKHNVTFCDLKDKLAHLFHFLRIHSSAKVLVFFSTCKQVRFTFEAFCKLRPGLPLLEIRGKQKQLSRTKTYYKFCEVKCGALFTTDVCSRGLDFPHVDYVVNFDCPDTFDLYVHRVGRTARYNSEGSSLLFVCDFEKPFMSHLQSNNISCTNMKLSSNNTSLTSQLDKICSKHADVKHLAERAFISYLRSIFILHGKDKALLERINMMEFASSFGLANVPYIKNSK
jgi:ATP-dependent RNA helicase DDX10/DBP4